MIEWIERKLLNKAMLYRLNGCVEDLDFIASLNGSINRNTGEKVKVSELADKLGWKARLRYEIVRTTAKNSCKADKETFQEMEKMIGWLEEFRAAFRIPLWQVIYNCRKY